MLHDLHISEPNIQKALQFYRDIILGELQLKASYYVEKGFALQVSSTDWEVFAAILMNDRKKPGYGSDLIKHEVKSGSGVHAFEYQYHRNTGLQKLLDDKRVNHVFISYSPDYENIKVWWVEGEKLKDRFDQWENELREAYKEPRAQRFRKNIALGEVRKLGRQILEIRDGKLYESGGASQDPLPTQSS